MTAPDRLRPCCRARNENVALVAGTSWSVQGGIRQASSALGKSSATLLTCVFSSQHFSSYPALFPQRCALIVPCIDHESIRRLSMVGSRAGRERLVTPTRFPGLRGCVRHRSRGLLPVTCGERWAMPACDERATLGG